MSSVEEPTSVDDVAEGPPPSDCGNDDDDDDDRPFGGDEFAGKPVRSEGCTVEENVLRLHHSFGYDCFAKVFNICAADDHTVVYAAGSYICIFDVNTGNLSFRKCAGNGGIGHIAKNPVFGHLTIGEKCSDPPIVVYEWPTFRVVSVLTGGAKRQINWLDYSYDGKYLCSQGGEPDQTLIIWDWKRSKIVLKVKSHTQDVHICRFSTYIANHIVTAGSGHIKFWKMANTFTGLKLKGQLGRFGKTEVSNVVGVLSMPDEKVISGCEWGDILVWDEQLIDVQVTGKDRQPCHSAPIIMFLYSEQTTKLTSVGMDGMVKFWNYRTVDLANPPENDRVLELEPSFTIAIEDPIGTAKILGVCKVNSDPNSGEYFIQDGNGGLWLADMKVAEIENAKPPKRLAKFHGGAITSLLVSPVGHLIATTSMDGWFHVHCVLDKQLVYMQDFKEAITSSVWLPPKLAGSENVFGIGFRTGVLKIIAVPFKKTVDRRMSTGGVTEIQSSKPHTSSISHLTVNRGANILLSGSDDCTIFVYKTETNPVRLEPIGFYPLPGKVTFIHWNPSERRTVLISCSSGHVVELNVPGSRPAYTKRSFSLAAAPGSRTIRTASVKSEIVRDRLAEDARRRRADKTARKTERRQAAVDDGKGRLSYGADDDDDDDDDDDTSDDEPPDAAAAVYYVPPTPSPVLFAVYGPPPPPSGTYVWTSLDGYDAGYLYTYEFGVDRPVAAAAVPGKDDVPLTAIHTT